MVALLPKLGLFPKAFQHFPNCHHFYPSFCHSFDWGQVTTNPRSPNSKILFPNLRDLIMHYEFGLFPFKILCLCLFSDISRLHLNTQTSVILSSRQWKPVWHILFSGSEKKKKVFFLQQGVEVRLNPETILVYPCWWKSNVFIIFWLDCIKHT